MKKTAALILVMFCLAFFYACKKPDPKVIIIIKYSPECASCNMMKPIIAEIEKNYKNDILIERYNQEDYNEFQASLKYKSTITPAVFFLDMQRNVYASFEGPVEYGTLKAELDKKIPSK